MLLRCHFPAVIVKGLIEHGDGTTYFGSLGGYQHYLAEARQQRWIDELAETVTDLGRGLYQAEHLEELPQERGSRAYLWRWDELRGLVQVVTEEHTCVAVGLPPYRCTCDASNMHDGTWYLNRLFVHESVRGKGIGSRLLAHMVTLLQGRGTLIVDPGGYGSNPAKLRKWYRQQGFQTTAVKGRLQYPLGNQDNIGKDPQ